MGAFDEHREQPSHLPAEKIPGDLALCRKKPVAPRFLLGAGNLFGQARCSRPGFGREGEDAEMVEPSSLHEAQQGIKVAFRLPGQAYHQRGSKGEVRDGGAH